MPFARATASCLGLAWLAVAAGAEPRCLDDAAVCLDAQEQGAKVTFSVVNREAAPYSVRVMITERHNLEPSSPLPFRAVLQPGEERVVGALTPRKPAEPTRYALRWSAAEGDVRARHDDGVRYRMPFGGAEKRVLSQGPGGSESHRSGATFYSFDFAMPWGTPVLAARPGRVVRVVDRYSASGAGREAIDAANRVVVEHSDGTLATYAHLRQQAAVAVGQQVATGDTLGWSGDTGYSTGPHLHFMVWKREADLTWRSLPIRFHDDTWEGFVPEAGVAYAAGCARTGAPCAPGALPVSEPAAVRSDAPEPPALRRDDGACVCPNGAVIHVELACDLVCGR
jgi:murein DD-endopeptidase MepM/ murein hydrolase activator NlpD